MKEYNSFKIKIEKYFPKIFRFINRNKIIIKYIISGTTAASVDLSLLFLFTEFFKLHYILSASLAFAVAIVVSFSLQKFWTFRDRNNDVVSQMFVYIVVGMLNLVINAGLMFLLVDKLTVFYLLAQIITGGLIAIWSFLIYRVFIFKKGLKV